MKTIVFAPCSFNLSQTSWMVEIAKACKNIFTVVFMSYGGEFEKLIAEEGFEIRKMEPRITKEKAEHIYKLDKGEKIGYFFTADEISERLKGEIKFLREIKPAALTTGFSIGTPLSTRVVGVPLVWVVTSTFLPAFYEEGLGTWPDMFDFPFLRWIPDNKLNRMSRLFMALATLFLRPYNKVARNNGLKPFKGMSDFCRGEYTLIAEPPEFSGISQTPPNYHFIGPLLGRFNFEIPENIRTIPRDKPIIYFAMGSSGNPKIIASIIEGFAGRPYRVIAPVKKYLQTIEVTIPSNVIVTDWLPAHKVNPMADISVIHGGIGTVMTACLSGTPVVGVGMQPEQEANLECLVRKGFAVRIKRKRVTAKKVIDAIDQLLANSEAQRKAKAFKKVVEQWDGPTNAAEFLAEKYGN